MDRTHKLANINNLTYNRLLQLTTFRTLANFVSPNVLYEPFIKALPILTFELANFDIFLIFSIFHEFLYNIFTPQSIPQPFVWT